MEFRVLGPVELRADGRNIDLGPAKSRLLLAVLLMESGRTVPFDTLVDRVWNEAVPAKVANSVQSNLSRLRRRLEECHDSRIELLHTPGRGYRLLVPPEHVDVLEFTRIATLGRAAADQGQNQLAVDLLTGAARLVNGEPLSGLPGPWAEATRAGLNERIHAAAVQRIGLQLEADDPRTLIAELRELAGNHPFDEEVAGLLMRALHACGRTADALDEYKAIGRRLRHELGIDPHAALREIHNRVLGGRGVPSTARQSAAVAEPAASARPSADQPPAPNTLEREPPGFVGRNDDLNTLTHEITAQLQAGQSAVCVIDGMAGAGKSTLALKLAYLMQDRCPDGALHLNLRGHDANQPPTSSETALGLLLGMLRTDAQEVQRAAGLDHAIALWRRRTSNRRLLILLDDAISAEQILPLIPADPGSVILVTARTRLADLPDAIRHALPLMKTRDAGALFARAARIPSADDPADGAAVNAIVSLCGRLPLALSIAGGLLRMRSSWSVADLAEHLSRSLASAQSDTLTTRVTAAFDTSYRDLPDLPRRLFRRLALYPGSRVNLYAAAALVDAPVTDTDLALTTLVDHNLISEPQRHAYRMHELVRLFAVHVLSREESEADRAAAEARLLQFTVAAVESATRQFHPYRHVNLAAHLVGQASTVSPEFADAHQAAMWLDSEQFSLRVLIEYWYTHDKSWEAAALTHMLAMYLNRKSLWKEGTRLFEQALETWSRYDHAVGQATALNDLATAHWGLGLLDQARAYSEGALSLWTALGDTGGQADALLELGRAHQFTNQYPDAIDCFKRCAALHEANHEEHGQAVALYHLGTAMFYVGRPQDAIEYTQQALDLSRSIHDEAVERNCVNNLGDMYRHFGDYDRAEACCERALELAELLGDEHNIAVAMLNLGDIRTQKHFADSALLLLDSALEIFHRMEYKYGQTSALLAKARARAQLGESQSALALLEEARSAADSLGNSVQLANTHLTAGDIHLTREDHRSAEGAFRLALDFAVKARAPHLQAAAHQGIGDALAASQGSAPAREHWLRALELCEPAYVRQAELLRERLERSGPSD